MNSGNNLYRIIHFFKARKQNKLSYKLLLYVILCSSFFTFLATFVQLYFDYKNDIEGIHLRMNFIQKSYLGAVTASVYKIDDDQLRILLKGIVGLRDITFARVIEERGGREFSFTEGDEALTKDIIKEYKLIYLKGDREEIRVGKLIVSSSLKGVYNRLWNKFIKVLGTNAAKTFIASFFILLIIQITVTRHLNNISKYTETVTIKDDYPFLELNRKKPKKPDELDRVVSAINNMRYRIKSDFQEIVDAKNQINAALVEKKTLIKEIHHRVKNNLQIITSLIGLQLDHIKNEGANRELSELENRIRSMALVHELIYKSDDLAKIDFHDYVDRLAADLMNVKLKSKNYISFKNDVKDVTFNLSTAIPCGLILNELISNSIKYAFADGREGTIRVNIFTNSPGNHEDYTMMVEDNGIGLPLDFDIENNNSLGISLVHTLSRQIDGSISIDRNQGTKFLIKFSTK